MPSFTSIFAHPFPRAQYLAADVCMLVKSLFQVFEDAPCQWVLPAVDDLLADPTNRHKQRAAGELVGGASSGP